jgi:hypothetical protein
MGFLDRLFKKDPTPDNRALEKAIRDLAETDSPARRRAFYDLLKQSTLILATPYGTPDGRPKTSDGTLQIGFMASTDANGKPAMLAFTSEAALLAWRPVGCTYTALAARDVFRLAVQKELETIIVNSHGPTGGYITRSEFVSLAEGLYPGSGSQTLPTKGLVITSPNPLPAEEWLAALRSHAQTIASIRGLFLVTAGIDGGAPHYMIGVDLVAGVRPEQVMPRFLDTIRPTIEARAYVDFLPLADNSLGTEIRSKGLRIL